MTALPCHPERYANDRPFMAALPGLWDGKQVNDERWEPFLRDVLQPLANHPQAQTRIHWPALLADERRLATHYIAWTAAGARICRHTVFQGASRASSPADPALFRALPASFCVFVAWDGQDGYALEHGHCPVDGCYMSRAEQTLRITLTTHRPRVSTSSLEFGLRRDRIAWLDIPLNQANCLDAGYRLHAARFMNELARRCPSGFDAREDSPATVCQQARRVLGQGMDELWLTHSLLPQIARSLSLLSA